MANEQCAWGPCRMTLRDMDEDYCCGQHRDMATTRREAFAEAAEMARKIKTVIHQGGSFDQGFCDCADQLAARLEARAKGE